MKHFVKRIACVMVAAVAVAVTPVFAEDEAAEAAAETATETTSNKDKMKSGTKDFFNGLKGTFSDAKDSASKKVKSVTAPAYVGEWEFVNGKYKTAIDLEEDGTMIFTQSTKKGENKWTGTYTVAKKQMEFHFEKKNSKATTETWTLEFEADKNDKLILSSDDIPDDVNGYDFSRRTLFAYASAEE